MRSSWKSCVLVLAGLIAFSLPALAQSARHLPVPGYGAAKPVPNAQQLPDPNLNYKVVFVVSAAAHKVTQVNPGFVSVARYLNTLAEYGVPADHRHLVIVVHGPATYALLDNAAFRARNHGVDNPDIALIRSLTKAGVEIRVCGQGVLALKIDPKTLQSDVHLDLWALSTIVNYELHGYVRG